MAKKMTPFFCPDSILLKNGQNFRLIVLSDVAKIASEKIRIITSLEALFSICQSRFLNFSIFSAERVAQRCVTRAFT